MVTLAALAILQSQTLNPQIKVDHKSRHGYFSYKYSYPVFPASHKLNPLLNKESIFPVTRAKRQFVGAFQDFGEKPTAAWDSQLSPIISYNSNQLTSILFDQYEYTGGAHPNSWTIMVNIGNLNGTVTKLKLKDVLINTESKEFLNEFVLPKANKARLERVGEPVTELPSNTSEKFLISRNGLTFVFDRYELGAYVEGDYVIKLKWSELRGKINERLIPESAL